MLTFADSDKKKSRMAMLLFVMTLFNLATAAPKYANVTATNSAMLDEMKLVTGMSLGDKSYAYFNLTVTDNVYSRYEKGVHLAFNVYAT